MNAASLTIPLWFKYNCLFVSISIITSWFFVCKFFNKLIDIFDHLISDIQVLHVSFFKDIPLLRIYSGNSDILKLVVCLLILGVWLIFRRMSRYLLWVYLRKKWSPDDYIAWKSAYEGEGGIIFVFRDLFLSNNEIDVHLSILIQFIRCYEKSFFV